MKKKENLPKISIITPSFNQVKFIEKTIKSVLSQNYPNLEYIVMDGGSRDETVKILQKYSNRITWQSKKDKGQSNAINKGMMKATGEIIGYLNSDDYLEENTLFKIADFFKNNKQAFWVTGKCKIVDEKNKEVRKLITIYKNVLLKHFCRKKLLYIINFISQPSTFFRSEVVADIGCFDESLDYDMDYDYWLRVWSKYPLFYIDDYLASYRVHLSSKAVRSPETQFRVEYEIISRYTKSKSVLLLHKLHCNFAALIYKTFKVN